MVHDKYDADGGIDASTCYSPSLERILLSHYVPEHYELQNTPNRSSLLINDQN
jgi:hypothetical protein